MSGKELKRITANIRGRVQGVSFRYYTLDEAERLGLVGWVRNERDGSVSVVAEGTEEKLIIFLDFLHRGPMAARVSNVDNNWSTATGRFDTFEIRWL